ncbi:MAG: DNA-binding response regulator [Desulfuromonas sp.]|nr:MAG: DNA-binding response regulator [Desulfuromonas sp.]
MRKKRVLIVDDHPLFREGLKSLINRSLEYVSAGEAGSAEDAIAMVADLKPDLITMDISLPGKSGIDACREITRQLPNAQILIVSMHPKFEFIAEAFKAGARGYVVKEATSSRLIEAMDTLLRGEMYLDGGISVEIIAKLMGSNNEKASSEEESYELLTPREQQIMRLIVEGHTTKAIATQLDLSPKTVENHRANLMKKLDVHSKMELVRYAVKLGLIDVEQWKE